MDIEQIRVIGCGAYSRKPKVFDQTCESTLQCLASRCFLGLMFRPYSSNDSGLCSPMNVRFVPDVTVLVVRPVLPGLCEVWPAWREIHDPARITWIVAKALSLIDQEAELPIVFSGSGCLEDPLLVYRVRTRLIGPECPRVGDLLGQPPQVLKLAVGVVSGHRFPSRFVACGFCAARPEVWNLAFAMVPTISSWSIIALFGERGFPPSPTVCSWPAAREARRPADSSCPRTARRRPAAVPNRRSDRA